ncbi:uncharacterized protein B0H64DRAFT_25228 [Chaetomium fimeti]|uniref:Secreted protein n=1 Tax=Chaetomium fimeti TaxID=1854472 RepID=A0AAE0HQL1_9PEZI|nr:hypothetical protein B0H64DRAFT_25228 [Chaetomium fimeti]
MPALLFLTGLGQLIWATSAGSAQAYLGRAFSFCRFNDLPSTGPTSSHLLPTLRQHLLDRHPLHCRSLPGFANSVQESLAKPERTISARHAEPS